MRTKSSNGQRYFTKTVQKLGMTYVEEDLPSGAAAQMADTGIRPCSAFLNVTRYRAQVQNQNAVNMKQMKPTALHNTKVEGHNVDIMGSNMARSLKLTGSTPLMQNTRNSKTTSNMGKINCLRE